MELKDRIIYQAGELFVKHGIKRISMDEIASKLGISKRTIYQNFKDKEDLLLQYIRHLELMQIEYVRDLSKNEQTVVHVFLRTIEMHKEFDFFNVQFLDDVEKYYPKAKQELIEQQKRGITFIKEFLEEGIKQRVIREDLNIEVVSFLLQDSSRTFINATRVTNKSFSNWELFFTSMINFIRGISTAQGIEIVDNYLTKYYSNTNV
ncbi:MAG: TetR/AcrR family transcriptional regulator [Dysgonamonadaceae bacterium]|jgi:AcrR family transcriptional regulator|nr:TetR/AcrR family transcriptional regulator [Dysgonamonadaceae bacterium]MDD3727739.1 TetR/AcrR family transcriptional regulator [Dysgonamonadaceae bacterium]MDD4245687.1 TetR/AcrR family transcriptional regulator [Dysgonamonadaceae bacterium]MDD4605162.1 TetR/AcrR family transcriptional regulator [Dysgonamonadaceae bacterium]HUI32380.1 TetR/AcrR family transcriptional regulator [Dysgonamonadaceae bacterium]